MTDHFQDCFDLMCGRKIGEGIHRMVFECKVRPDLVVKVESDDYRYFANVLEFKFWEDHERYAPVSRWLAPCEFLSPEGRILLQKRCDKVPESYKLPKKMPEFLTDMKRDNFGILNGKLVCVDYAMTIPSPVTKLRNAEWW